MKALPRHPTSATALAAVLNHCGAHRRTALKERMTSLVVALGGPVSANLATVDLIRQVREVLAEVRSDRMWLALAVLGGRLPDQAAVERATRATQLDGPLVVVSRLITARAPGWPVARGPWPRVRIITGKVLVDLHHTAQTELATGIQRVARQSALRWYESHEPMLVGWTSGLTALRELTPAQRSRALYGNDDAFHWAGDQKQTPDVIVPWHCRYVLPELLTESQRARALLGMLRFSGSRGSMIGFDCVPLTSAETTAEGMGAGFAVMLAAIAYADRIAPISDSAAVEYQGWRAMLAGAGLSGPDIQAVPLPVERCAFSDRALAEARDLLVADGLPMVLCVGSHEPRKNHLAVLHAAELLWRDGVAFSLVFVGGNAWSSEQFVHRLHTLQNAGRPVESIRALSDDLLWAAYRLAHCTVFPSLNEGFGLPVAESLASGTPVITSRFGSMRDIAAGGGALLIDPRIDKAIADALRRLLTDDALHMKLRAQAAHLPTRTWAQYAEEAWRYLVDGMVPSAKAAERALVGNR